MKATLLRSILKIGAGILVSKGVINENEVEIGVAVVTGIIGIVWGLFDRRGNKKDLPLPPRGLQTPLFILSACLMLLTGCTTLTRTDTASLIAERAAYRITERVLLKHPEWQPHFETARAELIALLAEPQLDALAVIEILERLPAEALDGDTAVIVLDGIYITILVAGDPALTPEGETAVRAVVDGLVKGMNRRLRNPSL